MVIQSLLAAASTTTSPVNHADSNQLLYLVFFIIGVALIFDYINGFHDAANSIATIVATRVLTPFQAVLWAAFFNFVAAFLFGTAVAKTVGRGFVDLDLVTPYVILAGLAGAITWDLITWWLALPTSSSHALIGGLAGAAIVKGGTGSLDMGFFMKTAIFIVVSPLVGMALGAALMRIFMWLFGHRSPSGVDRTFRRLQLFSAALYSL